MKIYKGFGTIGILLILALLLIAGGGYYLSTTSSEVVIEDVDDKENISNANMGTVDTSGENLSDENNDTETQVSLCDVFTNARFVSTKEYETGPSPEGVSFGHWSISFDAQGEWEWFHSDYAENGTYICDDGMLTATKHDGEDIEVSYDTATGILLWNGIEYKI
jgi:hypothetical protein